MATKSSSIVGQVGRGVAFVMLGLLAPWQFLNMLPFSNVIEQVALKVPEHIWETFAFAWLAVHAYCLGFIIWGQWRTVLFPKPPETRSGGPLTRMILGVLLVMTAYVLLVEAIVSSW